MKVGPVHVVTDSTMREMMSLMHRYFRGMHDAADLARRLMQQPYYLHATTNDDRVAPPVVTEPDADHERSRMAAKRVVAAYQRTRESTSAPAPGMWNLIEANNSAFLEALNDSDVGAVRERLAGMLQDDVSWGLGCCGREVTAWLREAAPGNRAQLTMTDVLVSLAEAVGALRVTSPEQNPADHARPLTVDLDAVYRNIRRVMGVSLSQPLAAGAIGGTLAGEFVSADTVGHGYTLHRLRQLGIRTDSTIVEIGGGYGCLAELSSRNGVTNYTIVDLPWVNALQGYYLLMTRPPESVQLYGENSDAPTRVLPFWCFDELPSRSVQAVVNTNSMPEMGEDTAGNYLRGIRRILRDGVFLSINQEAKAPVADLGPQLCVAELIDALGTFRRLSRHRFWLRHGYVEEVYVPS
jgi:hypothetical protein